eukprot:1637193-Rhodomonas_salina.4
MSGCHGTRRWDPSWNRGWLHTKLDGTANAQWYCPTHAQNLSVVGDAESAVLTLTDVTTV